MFLPVDNVSHVICQYLAQDITYLWKLGQNLRCQLVLISLLADGASKIVRWGALEV